MTRKQVTQTPRTHCYFCGSEGPIQTHHIVPERYGGSDDEKNLVDLCPTCHERLERLYDSRFYSCLSLEARDIVDGSDEEFEANVVEAGADTGTYVDAQDVIEEIEPTTWGDILNELCDRGVAEDESEAQHVVDNLRSKGKIFEGTQGWMLT